MRTRQTSQTVETSKARHYLSSSETEFVLVGVAHLEGDEYILRDLQTEGYTVARWEEDR